MQTIRRAILALLALSLSPPALLAFQATGAPPLGADDTVRSLPAHHNAVSA